MIVLNQKPIAMAEIKEYVSNLDEKKVLEDYLKAFTKLKKDKAIALAKEIRDLNNIKLRESDIIKLVDFIPRDQEEINKILVETQLTEEEANAILEVVKKY